MRIYPNGRKVFRDRNNGDPITIGPFPAISLSTFHARLKQNNKLRGRGIDPKEHQKQQRIATDRAKAEAAAALTVEQLLAEFIAEHVRKRHKDPGQCERLLNAEILGTEVKPKWRHRKVNELTLRDAVLLTRAIDERAPAVANDTVSLIKKLWRFGASQGHDIDAKEMADLEKQNPEEPRLSRSVAIALKLLLVTAQRRGELLKACWSDIDLDKKLWTIPEAHLKTAKKRRKKADSSEDEPRREKADMPTQSRRPTPEQIAEELDVLVETRDVGRATCYTRRWISVLIARGQFPPPDVRGRRGSAHRWRRSTIRRYLDSISQSPQSPS